MAKQTAEIRQKVENLLQQQGLSVVNLRREFEELASKEPYQFREYAADLWAPALFQRDAEYLGEFLTSHLASEQKDIIQILLEQIETKGPEKFFYPLYEKIHNEDSWNQDLLNLAQSDAPDDVVLRAVKLRAISSSSWQSLRWSISEEAAFAVYQRSPAELGSFVRNHVMHAKGGRFERLREEVQRQGDEELYWWLFRKFANGVEWLKALQELLRRDIAPEKIGAELAKRQPEQEVELGGSPSVFTSLKSLVRKDVIGSAGQASAESHIWQALLDKYGKAVIPHLEKNVRWYYRQQIEDALAKDLAPVELLQGLDRIASTNWRFFREMAPVWAPALYDRLPDLCEDFLRHHLGNSDVIRELLPRIEAAGQDDLFSALYRQIVSNKPKQWEEDVLALAQSDLSDADVYHAIQRRKSPRYETLRPETALALYRRNPGIFRSIIRNHITYGAMETETLLQEIERQGDQELYWHVFRKVADGEWWQAEIERLIAQETPAEQIVGELEKRHPEQKPSVQPEVWFRLLEKYGAALTPYLERHMTSMSRRRLEALLALNINRGALLHELERMSWENGPAFRELADVWAPALYALSPEFFKSFLVRHLNRWENASVIYRLLERAETDGHDDLFRDLYGMIVRHDEWEKELLDLAHSDQSDEQVSQAVARRTSGRARINTPEVALALYQRNPAVFRNFLREHVADVAAENLRDEAKKLGDLELYLHLQHITSRPAQRQEDVEKLLDAKITLTETLGELERLVPHYHYREDDRFFDVVLQLLERHGEPILPFAERCVPVSRKDQLLEVVSKMGNQALYWRTFLNLRDSKAWNNALRDLLKQPLSPEELQHEIQFRTPPYIPSQRSLYWQPWSLAQDVALELYQRDAVRFRPFIERFIDEPGPELYALVEAHGDEQFLDFLTIHLLQEAMRLTGTTHYQSWWNEYAQEARRRLDEIEDFVKTRFDRLYAASPEQYVRHAAMVLGYFRAFEIWMVSKQMATNPVFSYIATQHYESWRRSPYAIRELMESPNIFVQIIGLEILDSDGPDAAARVSENLPVFRALLLGRARSNTKKRVLRCLERAARQDQKYLEQVLPILEEAKDLRGSRSISEHIVVSYVRLKHDLDRQKVCLPEGG